MRQNRKKIAGCKSLVDKTEREQEFCLHDRTRNEISGHDEYNSHGGKRLRGQLFVNGIEHHADTQQMQHAEPDDHIARGHAEAIHPKRYKRNEHAAREDNAAAAEAA